MDLESNVPLQASLTVLTVLVELVLCGHRAGLATVVVSGTGLVIVASLAVWYTALVPRRKRRHRRGDDARARNCAIVGFGVPLALGLAVALLPSFDGLAFPSLAGAWAGVAAAVVPTAILTSSMTDHFFVLPRVAGMGAAPAAWESDPSNAPHRRRLAQHWIFHRGFCELLVSLGVAVAIAVIVVGAEGIVTDDHVLTAALEGLGGAGVAVGVFGFAGPRIEAALRYMLAGEVGIGAWCTGQDGYGRPVEGLVIDISVDPGLKLVQVDGTRVFIGLRDARGLTPARRPDHLDADWYEERFRERP